MKQEHALAAIHWLGLQPQKPRSGESDDPIMGRYETVRGVEPDGCLHHGRRGALVMRHTSSDAGRVHLPEAIAKAYPPNREKPLLVLLKPQRLDDAFWRQVYAVMVQGGPGISRGELVAMVVRLTQPDLAAARAEAMRLFQGVFEAHRRLAQTNDAAEAGDSGTRTRGRPSIPEEEKAKPLKITLSPGAHARLEELGPNKSAAIERLIMGID